MTLDERKKIFPSAHTAGDDAALSSILPECDVCQTDRWKDERIN